MCPGRLLVRLLVKQKLVALAPVRVEHAAARKRDVGAEGGAGLRVRLARESVLPARAQDSE